MDPDPYLFGYVSGTFLTKLLNMDRYRYHLNPDSGFITLQRSVEEYSNYGYLADIVA